MEGERERISQRCEKESDHLDDTEELTLGNKKENKILADRQGGDTRPTEPHYDAQLDELQDDAQVGGLRNNAQLYESHDDVPPHGNLDSQRDGMLSFIIHLTLDAYVSMLGIFNSFSAFPKSC